MPRRGYQEEVNLGLVGDGLVPTPPLTANVAVPASSYVWLRPDADPEHPILAQNLSGRALADGQRVQWIWLSQGSPSQAAILGRLAGKALVMRTQFISGQTQLLSLWKVKLPSSPVPLATAADLTELGLPVGATQSMDTFLTFGGRLHAWNGTLRAIAAYQGSSAVYQQVYGTTGDGAWLQYPLPLIGGEEPSPNFNGRMTLVQHNSKLYAIYKLDPSSWGVWQLTPPNGVQLVATIPNMNEFAPIRAFSLTPTSAGKIYVVVETTSSSIRIFSYDFVNPPGQVANLGTNTLKMPIYLRTDAGHYVVQIGNLNHSLTGDSWGVVLTPLGIGLTGQSATRSAAATDVSPHGLYYCNYDSPFTNGFPATGPGHGNIHYGPDSASLGTSGNVSRLTFQSTDYATFTLVSTLTPGGSLSVDGLIDVMRTPAPLNMVFASMFTDFSGLSQFDGGIYTLVETDDPILSRWRRWLANELLAPAGYTGGALQTRLVDDF